MFELSFISKMDTSTYKVFLTEIYSNKIEGVTPSVKFHCKVTTQPCMKLSNLGLSTLLLHGYFGHVVEVVLGPLNHRQNICTLSHCHSFYSGRYSSELSN